MSIVRYVAGLLCLGVMSTAIAGTATLSWTPPTQNSDGTPLTDLSHYTIRAGCQQAGQYEEQTTGPIAHPITSVTISALPEQTDCYFVATATNLAGVESVYSNEATKYIESTTVLADPVDNLVIDWTESTGAPVVAERTGTASTVRADGSDNSSTSVTVPSDATAVVALYNYWDNNTNAGAPTFSINSVNMTSQAHIGDVSDKPAVGVQTLANPATGSQTFAWDWGGASGARAEGGTIYLVYVKGVDTSDLVRDAQADSEASDPAPTVTINSNTSDLVIAEGSAYTGTDPGTDGTQFIDNDDYNSVACDVTEVTAGASTTTVDLTNHYYSTIVAISLKEGSSGATGTASITGGGAVIGAREKGAKVSSSISAGGALSGSATRTEGHTGTASIVAGGQVTATGTADESHTGTSSITGGGTVAATVSGDYPRRFDSPHIGIPTKYIFDTAGATYEAATGFSAISGGLGISASGLKGAEGEWFVEYWANLSATGRKDAVFTPTITGGGIVIASGAAEETQSGTLTLTGGGTLSGLIEKGGLTTVAASAGGAISAAVQKASIGSTTVTAAGALSAEKTTDRVQSAIITGGGVATVFGSPGNSARVRGGGQIVGVVAKSIAGALALTGSGSVLASGDGVVTPVDGQVVINGGGSITTSGVAVETGTGIVSVSGGGALTVVGGKNVTDASNVTASAAITLQAQKSVTDSAAISGGGSVTAGQFDTPVTISDLNVFGYVIEMDLTGRVRN